MRKSALGFDVADAALFVDGHHAVRDNPAGGRLVPVRYPLVQILAVEQDDGVGRRSAVFVARSDDGRNRLPYFRVLRTAVWRLLRATLGGATLLLPGGEGDRKREKYRKCSKLGWSPHIPRHYHSCVSEPITSGLGSPRPLSRDQSQALRHRRKLASRTDAPRAKAPLEDPSNGGNKRRSPGQKDHIDGRWLNIGVF